MAVVHFGKPWWDAGYEQWTAGEFNSRDAAEVTATSTKRDRIMSAASKPKAQATAMVTQQTAESKVMEYLPFGAMPGDIVRLSVPIVRDLVAVKTKSGKVPTDRDIIKFMMLCKARRLNPFEGDAYLVGYDGKDGPIYTLITGHQAYLKRAASNPDFDGMQSGVIVITGGGELLNREGDFLLDTDTLVGAWASVHFKRKSHPMTDRINLKAYRKPYGIWQTDPAGMCVKCFDDETEVLTTKGFERFSEVQGRILQVTDSGLEATDSAPFVQQYAGSMVTLDSDDLNFCVTPNHDMLTTAGKIEASRMFDEARARPKFWIPRSIDGSKPAMSIMDETVILAAVYLTDGHDAGRRFTAAVSRPYKVEFLESLGAHESRQTRECAGTQAVLSTRTITTKRNKHAFHYAIESVAPLVSRGKQINVAAILSLSKSQAKLFVDTLLYFDGSVNKETGVRRFYQSKIETVQAFEIAAVVAGYSVSPRTARQSDISTKDNFVITISERSEIPVMRKGREYRNPAQSINAKHRTGLKLIPNESGRVWCCTVPSGVIVVRRNGFSMLCGNCAESSVLRKAFPTMFVGFPEEQLIDQSESQGLPAPTREFTPVETMNGNRIVVSENQESKLKAALNLVEGSELLVRDFYGLHHGQKLLACEFDDCMRKITNRDFSPPLDESPDNLAEGEIPNEPEMAEYTADEVDAALKAAGVDPLPMFKRFGDKKRAADLTQAERAAVIAELAQTVT